VVASANKAVEGRRVDTLFVGTYRHSLDTKRRFTIPSEWRGRTKDERGLYVLPRVEGKCLCVFTESELTERLTSVGRFSILDQKAREFTRVLGSRAALVAWDPQGRVRIKDELLEEINVTDSVALVGNFWFFEIWNPKEFAKSGGTNYAKLVKAVRHVGL